MSDEGAIAEVLAERPDLEEPLAAVLAVDRREETWTYDDLPIDSGPFGELVSRGIVESVGEEYRLADPAATERALERGADGTGAADTTAEANGAGTATADTGTGVSLPTPNALPSLAGVDRTTGAVIAAAIAVVALVRVHAIGAVYRQGAIVLSGNDPYYYRYWIEQVADASGGAVDFAALSELPVAVQKGEPLTVATLWWFAELLGGSVAAIGHVLAWYPVVSAVITAGLVYVLAAKLTGDRRIAVAAVLLLAIVPGHALRTAIGFADHHAFDYPWLVATALGLVVLADADRASYGQPRTWLAAAGLGVAVAAQVLAWEAGPLLIAPAGVAVLALSLVAVRDDRSPLPATGPILAGLGVAAVLAGVVHLVVGWHTAEVGFAPALVLVGSTAVVGVAEGIYRTTGEPLHALAIDLAAGVAGLLALSTLFPASWASLLAQIDRLVASDEIAETIGLFNPGTWGFLLLFGFVLILALPAMVWALRRSIADARWAILATYAWYFLVLAGFQVRFVGELAAFAAVFAGVGFVWIAAWIDAVPWPDLRERVLEPLAIPDRSTVLTLVLLFALVGSLGFVQVPVKTSQVTIEDDSFASAAFVAEQSAELGQSYPDNYVLSQWGRNRMYNYFVSGEARSYAYARENYREFASGTDPDEWYGQFRNRVGYVVMERADEGSGVRSAIWRLTRHFGSAREAIDGVAHFRPMYRAPGDSRTVVAVVPGARITGTAPANETVTVSTEVTIPEDTTFEYVRRTTAGADGTYSVTVANPGTYAVAGPDGNATVAVEDAAVWNGTGVAVGS